MYKDMEYKEYREEVNRIFQRYIRKGFVDYSSCSWLENDLTNLLLAASETLSKRGEYTDGKWHIKLKDVYKKLGDDDGYRSELLEAMDRRPGNKELWTEYKALFSAEEWPEICNDYFNGLGEPSYGACPWYAMENRYDLVIEAAEQNESSDIIKTYEKKLKVLYLRAL